MIVVDEGSLLTILSMSTIDPQYALEQVSKQEQTVQTTNVVKQAQDEATNMTNIKFIKVRSLAPLLSLNSL